MFNKKEKRAWEIFKILLGKFPEHPIQIKERDILKLYIMSTKITNSIEKGEYLYKFNGSIDDNIFKGEEIIE